MDQMETDRKQDKDIARLWSEFVVIKHVVQGNGSPGLAIRIKKTF